MLVDEVYVLNVADTEWSVTVSRRAIQKVTSRASLEPPRGAVAGLTNCLDGRIYVAPEGPESHRRAVLWHEVWHAAFDSVGGMRLSAEPQEDDVITQISQVLLDTLRRNGRLTAALLHESPAAKFIGKRYIKSRKKPKAVFPKE